MNKYENALKQVCLQCKTKPANCNKKKCIRYNTLKELVDKTNNPKSNWTKRNAGYYTRLFHYKNKGILKEFLDNEDEIQVYLESVGD